MYSGITHEKISERAYHIWLSEDKPNGREAWNWLHAELQLVDEQCAGKYCSIKGEQLYISFSTKYDTFICAYCQWDLMKKHIPENLIEWSKFAHTIFPKDLVFMINNMIIKSH